MIRSINMMCSLILACFMLAGSAWGNNTQELDPKTVATYRNIDLLYDLTLISVIGNDMDHSLQYLDELIPLVHANFSKDHPENLSLMTMQSIVSEEAGDMLAASKFQQQFQELKNKSKDHPAFTHSSHRVMRIYVFSGQKEKLRELIKDIVEVNDASIVKHDPNGLLVEPERINNGPSKREKTVLDKIRETMNSLKEMAPFEEPFLAPYKKVLELQIDLDKVKKLYGVDDLHYGYLLYKLGVFYYNNKSYSDAITAFEAFKGGHYLTKKNPAYVMMLHYLAYSYKFSKQDEQGDQIIADIHRLLKKIDFYIRNPFPNPEKPPYAGSFSGVIFSAGKKQVTAFFTATKMENGVDESQIYDPKLRAERLRVIKEFNNNPDAATKKYQGKKDGKWNILIAEEKLLNLKKDFGIYNPEYSTQALKLGFIKAQNPNTRSEALDYLIDSQKFLAPALVNILAFSTEDRQLTYIKENEQGYQAALYLVADQFTHNQAALRKALDLILNHKGMILDFAAQKNLLMFNSLDDKGKELWQQRKVLKQQLIQLLLRNTKNNREKVVPLKDKILKIDRKLMLSMPQKEKSHSDKIITSKVIAKKLKSGVVLLEFVKVPEFDWSTSKPTGNSRYMVFSLNHRGDIELTSLGETKTIDLAIQATIKYVQDKRSVQDKDFGNAALLALSRLHKLLWFPLQKVVEGMDGVVISPEGNINLVPFAALYSSEYKFLIEDKAITYVTSGRDLLRSKTNKKPKQELALFAYPFYGDPRPEDCADPSPATRGLSNKIAPFCELKGTKKEAKGILKYFKKSPLVFTEMDATKEKLMSISSPKVLHIATHAFFLQAENNALRSPEMQLARLGLAMAGANEASTENGSFRGIMTALEVSAMDLHATDLVTLSACETGLGDIEDGEGVYGFRRSFVMAGAKNLLMTLWSVDDVATKNIMKKFYAHYTDGEAPSRALRQAQVEFIAKLREKNNIAPPYYWAPFIIQGSEGVEAEKESAISKGFKDAAGSIVDGIGDSIKSPFKLFGF